jgi:hypothetical protein
MAFAIRQADRLKLLASVVRIPAGLRHHRHLFLFAAEEMKGIVACQLLVELYLPLSFEIDGVDQKHDRVRRDLPNELFDFALRTSVHPAIDRGGTLRIAEIERGDCSVKELAIPFQEVRFELDALARPE